LKVGAAEVNNLTVVVHDFSLDPRLEGLPGWIFLSRYQVELDSQKQVLVLFSASLALNSPRKPKT
jgi:hypothetical protein